MRVLLVASLLKDDLYQLDLSQLEVPLKPNFRVFVSSLNGHLFSYCSHYLKYNNSQNCTALKSCNMSSVKCYTE